MIEGNGHRTKPERQRMKVTEGYEEEHTNEVQNDTDGKEMGAV